jgi:hypothetical protein
MTGERWYDAEVRRLRGKLLRVTGDSTNAEVSFRRAVMISQEQSAKLFELRASTSLAHHWRDQGIRTEARDLLASVYGWFTVISPLLGRVIRPTTGSRSSRVLL